MVINKQREERIQWLEGHLKWLHNRIESPKTCCQELDASIMSLEQHSEEYRELTGRDYVNGSNR